MRSKNSATFRKRPCIATFTKLTKVEIREEFRIQASNVFFRGGGRVAVVRHVWLLQICSKNFCPLCTFKPHAMPGRNCRDVISDFIINVPHDKLVYPPKIYLPTLIIVTVGPLPSHREWNVLEAQPSTDARQQRFQTEVLLCSTVTIHLQNH